jgi:hypothetical protein
MHICDSRQTNVFWSCDKVRTRGKSWGDAEGCAYCPAEPADQLIKVSFQQNSTSTFPVRRTSRRRPFGHSRRFWFA